MRLATAVFVVSLGLTATAQAAPKPDLAASKPGGVPGSASPLEGFQASILTRNLGRGGARPTRIAFFLSKDRRRSAKDLRFATELRARKLKGGKRAKSRGRLVVPLDAGGGRWFVIACVDGAGALREAKEGNNCAASRRLRVAGPDPLKVGFSRQEPAEVDADAASTVTAVDGGGTVYTLQISQDDAEAFDTLRVTPIAALTPVPRNVAPAGGVVIEPAGIALDGASLTIQPPSPVPARGLAGYAAGADGSEFHLLPARVSGGDIVIEVPTTGVVGYGTVRGSAPEDEHLPAAPANRLSQAAAVALAGRGGSARVSVTASSLDLDDYERRACDYYTGGLKPRLLAATTRGKKEVVYALVRETLAMLHNAAVIGVENPPCTDGYLELLERIIKRVFDESYKECKTAGGDPFDEGLTMLSMLRQGQLLGFPENPDSWLGPGALDKIVECSVLAYDVTYSAAYETRTDGGWSSTGSVSAPTMRVRLGAGQDSEVSLAVPDPSASFFGECSGSFVGNKGGSVRVRGVLVMREKYKAGTVNGRFDPHAEVVLERELRFKFFHQAVVLYRIECGGGPSDWDLAGDGSGIVRLPVEGGTASAVSDTFPTPGEGDQTCVECERSTGTLSVRASAR